MFERFTADARMTVVEAQNVARGSHSPSIDTAHLLAGIATIGAGAGAHLLSQLGVSIEDVFEGVDRIRRRGGVSDSDAEALSEFGIDVDAIVERIEQAHGPGALAGSLRTPKRGHIPFTGEAKKTLEQSLAQALELGDKHIGQEHILLALAAGPGVTADLLARRGAGYPALLALVQQRKAG